MSNNGRNEQLVTWQMQLSLCLVVTQPSKGNAASTADLHVLSDAWPPGDSAQSSQQLRPRFASAQPDLGVVKMHRPGLQPVSFITVSRFQTVRVFSYCHVLTQILNRDGPCCGCGA